MDTNLIIIILWLGKKNKAEFLFSQRYKAHQIPQKCTPVDYRGLLPLKVSLTVMTFLFSVIHSPAEHVCCTN